MTARNLALLLVVAVACAAPPQAAATTKPWLCPPKRFDSLPDFNLAKFISAPWYVQAQIPLKYQPLTDLFCVRAKYTPVNTANLAAGVKVCNYANRGGVNKLAVGTCLTTPPAGTLTTAALDMVALPWPAKRTDPATAASKLLVGPTAAMMKSTPDILARPPMPGQQRVAGPYWIVAAGPSKTPALGYDWAIITGGAPSQATENDACVPPSATDDGVWLFSRTPVAPAADMAAMMAAAKALRIDTAALVPVKQTGCTYAGASV